MISRETLEINRSLEFFTENGLSAQIGFHKHLWAIALLKELIDNGLDACESGGIKPAITVRIGSKGFSIKDNANGLPENTLKASLNFGVNVTDKQGYISPSRGQQGNALKTLWAAPFVANGKEGIIEVITALYAYRVKVRLDAIANEPQVILESLENRENEGTLIRVCSEELRRSLSEKRVSGLVYEFSLFNPHAHFQVFSNRELILERPAAVESFKKWTPADPVSSHWYGPETFERLVSLLIANGRKSGQGMTIRDFIKFFDGLKRTDKQKAIGMAIAAKRLEDLATLEGLNSELTSKLLELLQGHSEPVKPERLGVIGKDSINLALEAIAAPLEKYKKLSGFDDEGMPYIIEVALARYEGNSIIYGVNFSPSVGYSLPGDIKRILSSENILIDEDDPIALVIHITVPRLTFNDKGKAQANLSPKILESLKDGLEFIAKDWAKNKRKLNRQEKAEWKTIINTQKPKRVTVKTAAYHFMEEAYRAVSDNGRLPANARQLMYYCRPRMIEMVGKVQLWGNDSYFTQHLLPDFIRDNPETTANWDVIYDNRGNFSEPLGHSIPLGTLAVRNYINSWRSPDFNFNFSSEFSVSHAIGTVGPQYRFKFALFIEKEGFLPILERAAIARRYDIAIFSTKGMSNTAARSLVESLSCQGVTILICHDFDKSGLTIARTLAEDTRRYEFRERPNVIDLGLRLADVNCWDLDSEPVKFRDDPIEELRRCNCSGDEIKFLARPDDWGNFTGDRVELNAFTSGEFIEWIESKLEDHGVTKVIPDDQTLTAAYRLQNQRGHLERFIREKINPLIEDEVNRLKSLETSPPDDLREAIAAHLKEDPAIPWDLALWKIVQNGIFPSEDLAC